MRDRLDEFAEHGAVVVVILFTRARNLRGYRSRYVAPLTCLTDEARRVYADYGLGRGRWWRVWGPKVWGRYATLLLRRGATFTKPTEDTSQLGGDFVVGRDGRLVVAFRQTGPEERPDVDRLIAAVASSG